MYKRQVADYVSHAAFHQRFLSAVGFVRLGPSANGYGRTDDIGVHHRVCLLYTSELDEVPGIGPRRRRALLLHFGSLEKLRQASVEDLLAVPELTRPVAQALYSHLHG